VDAKFVDVDHDDHNDEDDHDDLDNDTSMNIFEESLKTITKLLSTSNDDVTGSDSLMSDVHVHRVLVSIRCLRDLHNAQSPPINDDGWKEIAEIVDRAEKVEELSLLPFPMAEIARLHRNLAQHVAIQR
jgi:hypothetical protein